VNARGLTPFMTPFRRNSLADFTVVLFGISPVFRFSRYFMLLF